MDEKRDQYTSVGVGRYPYTEQCEWGTRETNAAGEQLGGRADGCAKSQPPSLLMRTEAIHRVLDQIDSTLEGHAAGKVEAESVLPMPANAELTVGRIGEGLDKALARLDELRARLESHMKALR